MADAAVAEPPVYEHESAENTNHAQYNIPELLGCERQNSCPRCALISVHDKQFLVGSTTEHEVGNGGLMFVPAHKIYHCPETLKITIVLVEDEDMDL